MKIGYFFYNMGFPIHFPIPPLTFHIIKLQPLGVERQMNPFWKVERWGNHMGKLEGNLKCSPGPPPIPLTN